VFLLDQAPSISEIRNGKAFQGQAGDSIRQIFATAGVRPSRFDPVIYQAYLSQSVFQAAKRVLRKNKRTVEMLFNEENRVPNSKEIENCRPFLQRQIQYLRPKVIILLGKLAIEA
jgi:uracil-DNA glycosylase